MGKLASSCAVMFSPSSLASSAAAPSQGLGKTVECIALVLERMDRREGRGSRMMMAPQQTPGECPICCLTRPTGCAFTPPGEVGRLHAGMCQAAKGMPRWPDSPRHAVFLADSLISTASLHSILTAVAFSAYDAFQRLPHQQVFFSVLSIHRRSSGKTSHTHDAVKTCHLSLDGPSCAGLGQPLGKIRGPTFIVTPPTILGQWEAEFAKHSDLKVRTGEKVLHGSRRPGEEVGRRNGVRSGGRMWVFRLTRFDSIMSTMLSLDSCE